eukprot:scaffold9356_cov56-Cyclotella_meneghiniana.AAC.2
MLSFGRCLFFVNLVLAPAGVDSVKGRSQRFFANGGYDDEEAFKKGIQNSLEDHGRHDKAVIDLTSDSPGTPSATSAEPPAASPAFAVVHHQLYPPEAELGSAWQLPHYTRPRLSHQVDMTGVFDVDSSDSSDDDADSDGGAGVENTPPPAGTEEGDKKPAAKPRPQRPPSHQVTRAPPALSEITTPNVTTRSGRESIKRMTMSVAEACGENECDSDSDASISDSDSDSDSVSDSTPFRDITNRNLPAVSSRQRTTRPQKKARSSQSTSSAAQASTQAASTTSSAQASTRTASTKSSAQASTRTASTTSSAQASTQATSTERDDYIELARDRFFEVHGEEAPENYPLEMEVRRNVGRNGKLLRTCYTCQMCPPDDRKNSQSNPNSHLLRLCARHTPRSTMRDRSCRHCRQSHEQRRGLCWICLKLLLPAVYASLCASIRAYFRQRYANDVRFRALRLLRGATSRIKTRSSVGLSTLAIVGLPRNSLYFALLRLLCNERNCSLESLEMTFSDNPNDRRQIDHVEPLAQVTTRDYWVRNGYDVIPDQEERDRRAGHWTVLDVITERQNKENGDRLEGRLRWIEAEGRWRAVPGLYSRNEYTLADLEAAENDDDLNELDLDEDELWD